MLALIIAVILGQAPVTWVDGCHVAIAWRPSSASAVLITKQAPDGTWAWYGDFLPDGQPFLIPRPGDVRPAAIPRAGDTVYLRAAKVGGSTAVTLLPPPSPCRSLWFPMAYPPHSS